MKIISLILITLLVSIKSEMWYDEVRGSDKNNRRYGYAGLEGNEITGFYLCGNRRYRVHLLNDPPFLWTREFTACEPVGNGRPIDGISISGGLGYQVRLKNGDWLGKVYLYNPRDTQNGMAGILGREIDSILVEGGDRYSVCIGGYSSSPEEVAKRVTRNWLGLSANFDFKGKQVLIDNYQMKVEGEVLRIYELEFDGPIKLIIENSRIKDFSCGGIKFSEINELFEKVLGDSFKAFRNWKISFPLSMENGQVTINIYYALKKIEFIAATKIKKDFGLFRGGFKVTFQVKEHPNNRALMRHLLLRFRPYVRKERKEEYSTSVANVNTFSGLPRVINNMAKPYQQAAGVATAFALVGAALALVPIII